MVEDEPNIRELLSTSLRYAGFEVRTAATGGQALEHAAREEPDLVVLDVMLPDLDGLAVLQRLRQTGRHTPVVFLTARDATEDKVAALVAGGDDYVTKPFSLEEVVARIQAVLRRTGAPGRPGALLRVGEVELDEAAHEVRVAGTAVSLSPTEFRLLRYLMVNAGRVLSKNQILDHVWEYGGGGDTAVVESYISYLRRKLDHGGTRVIRTVRGVGYVLPVPRPA